MQGKQKGVHIEERMLGEGAVISVEGAQLHATRGLRREPGHPTAANRCLIPVRELRVLLAVDEHGLRFGLTYHTNIAVQKARVFLVVIAVLKDSLEHVRPGTICKWPGTAPEWSDTSSAEARHGRSGAQQTIRITSEALQSHGGRGRHLEIQLRCLQDRCVHRFGDRSRWWSQIAPDPDTRRRCVSDLLGFFL